MAARRLAEMQPESFAFTAENRAWAEREIAKFPQGRQASAVISLLWRAQEQEGWVTKPAIEGVAEMLGMPQIRVLEVATFYTMFHLEPVGSMAHVQVCGTTPCMLRGAADLIEVCRRRIHHDQHHLSADNRLSWEEVECLGACVNAPMIQVSKDTYEDLTPKIFEGLLGAFERGETPEPGPQTWRQFSMPESGPTSLTEIQYADDDLPPSRPARAAISDAAADHGRAKVEKGEPQPAIDASVGGETLEAEQRRRQGLAPRKGGGTDPATPAAAKQEVGRVDPSGRADEAAARSHAGSEASPKAPADTHQSGPTNPGAKSDRDSSNGGKGS
jgi:NADH-quinone oxidoreductase subunit E